MLSTPAVLIVEDDASTGHLLEALVRRNHFEPTLAGDGNGALRQLQSVDFDVILLDLILPDIDGWEILRRLSLATPHLLHRIIIVTAAPEAMDRERDAMSMVWCTVRKPFELSMLEEQMLECCAERRRDAARIAAASLASATNA